MDVANREESRLSSVDIERPSSIRHNPPLQLEFKSLASDFVCRMVLTISKRSIYDANGDEILLGNFSAGDRRVWTDPLLDRDAGEELHSLIPSMLLTSDLGVWNPWQRENSRKTVLWSMQPVAGSFAMIEAGLLAMENIYSREEDFAPVWFETSTPTDVKLVEIMRSWEAADVLTIWNSIVSSYRELDLFMRRYNVGLEDPDINEAPMVMVGLKTMMTPMPVAIEHMDRLEKILPASERAPVRVGFDGRTFGIVEGQQCSFTYQSGRCRARVVKDGRCSHHMEI